MFNYPLPIFSNTDMMQEDFQVIITWNSNPEFIKIVEKTFENQIVLREEIKLVGEERAKAINDLYHPIHVPHNSTRCTSVEPITLFMVKMAPKYKYMMRTEGYLLCNSIILDFKTQYRKEFDFNTFHCSDSIEETKKALKVFGLEKHIPPHDIVPIEKIYTIIHLNDGYYNIVPMSNDVTVQHLIGYDVNFLHQKFNLINPYDPKVRIIQPSTLNYISSLLDFGQEHDLCKIIAFKYKDKHLIVDGKHRACFLYFKGNRHIFLHEGSRPCSDEIIEKSLRETSFTAHLENLHKFIYALHSRKIRFVVIRGFKTMPKTADTDLDLVIHPDDYQTFLIFTKEYIANNIIAFNVEKSFKHEFYPAWYRAFRTVGTLDDFLTNKDYQFDTYNHVFFFDKDQAVILNKEFLDYLFDNRKLKDFLYIPNELSEMVMLLCRTYIDLNGNWKDKHKARFNELKTSITKNEFIELLIKALPDKYKHLLSYVDELFT